MKKLFYILCLIFNSLLFAQNFAPYEGLDLGIKEEKLLQILQKNNVQYEYKEAEESYYIALPENFVYGFDCKTVAARLSSKRRVYQMELLVNPESGTVGFANTLKSLMNVAGFKSQDDPSKNKYKHQNTYAYWKKGFYVVEFYFNPTLIISVMDPRYR